jgi:hypothetical protein
MPDRFPTDTTSDPAGDPATTDLFGEPISVYTRAQAVADGVLVDVTAWASTGPEGMLGGFTVPGGDRDRGTDVYGGWYLSGFAWPELSASSTAGIPRLEDWQARAAGSVAV